MTQQHDEIERKYDVPHDARVPLLPNAGRPTEHRLDATYFDTSDHRLQQARITLRRRTGGDDAGWHLKLPATADSRIEVRLPLTDPATVPEELLDRVREHLHGRPVVPIATLRTLRSVRRLRDLDGRVLAEFCDDRVEARADGDGSVKEWREWEVELVDGERDVFDRLDPLLRAAGAVSSRRASKLQRALDREATAGELLVTQLRVQLDRLLHHNDRFQSGEIEESVHQMRVAARRTRSLLATYRRLFTPEGKDRAARLRDELRWFGASLGEARDMTVLRTRIDGLLDPDDTATTAFLDRELGARHDAGLAHAAETLQVTRYSHLLARLEALTTAPPFSPAAEQAALAWLPPALEGEVHRVRRRHRKQVVRTDAEERAHGLHEVRKAAKRLRYAAESALPVLGSRAERLAQRAEALQELLGEHQDTVVAQEVLAELAAAPGVEETVVHGLRRVMAAEQARAAELQADYERTLAPVVRRRTWMDD